MWKCCAQGTKRTEDRTWTVTWGKESDLIASLRENEWFIRKGGGQKKSSCTRICSVLGLPVERSSFKITNSQAKADASSVPGWERSPEGGNGNSLHYSCLENPWTEEPGRLQDRKESDMTEYPCTQVVCWLHLWRVFYTVGTVFIVLYVITHFGFWQYILKS